MRTKKASKRARGERKLARQGILSQEDGTHLDTPGPSVTVPDDEEVREVGLDPNAAVFDVRSEEPFIVTLARQKDLQTVQQMEEKYGPESAIREFFKILYPGMGGGCKPAADFICSVCPGAQLSNLEREDEAAGYEEIALVAEAKLDSKGKVVLNTTSPPLSAKDLGQRRMDHILAATFPLIRPASTRLNESKSQEASKPRHRAARQSTGCQSPRLGRQASQRRVYVTDLNRRSIQALIKTCPSSHEALHLCSAMYKHLRGETCLTYFTTGDGLRTYRYSLHLPYVVWQDGDVPSEDPRRVDKSWPLRKTEELTKLELGRGPDKARSFLYEAHTTCVIAGTDPQHWVAWCFRDTYYAGDAEYEDSIEFYAEAHMDPFMCGQQDLRIWRAPEYFLDVAIAQIRLIRDNWENVVNRAWKSMRVYEFDQEKSPSGPSALFDSTANQHPISNEEFMRESREWVTKSKKLNRRLSAKLSTTVHVLEEFRRTHESHFRDFARATDKWKTLVAIINEFKTLNDALRNDADECETLRNDLEWKLSHESHENGKSQEAIAQEGKHLNHLNSLFNGPLVCSLTTLAMERPLFPHLPQNFWVLMLVYICYSGLYFGLWFLIKHRGGLISAYNSFSTRAVWTKTGKYWAPWRSNLRERNETGDEQVDEMEMGDVSGHDGYQRS